MTVIIPVLALLLRPRPGRVLRLRLGLCAEDEERREADGGRRERDPVAGLQLRDAPRRERSMMVLARTFVCYAHAMRALRRTRGDAERAKCGRAVCLASLAVRRCRRRITAASRQSKPRMRPCVPRCCGLGGQPCKPAEAVLLVAVTHATRRSTQRRILLALRDACYAKTPLQYLRAVRTPPLHHEQPIKATLLRGHLHNLRERLPAAKQWKKSNTTARG